MKRLCEVVSEMRDPVLELGTHGDVDTLRRWAGLRCPRRDHCDQSRKCEGMTGQNLQTISELKDKLFQAGFVQIEK